MNEEMIVVLEIEDLLECDKSMAKIKVDKGVFDRYEENSYIEIEFADDVCEDLVYCYIMVAEDDEGIYMELMED